MTWNQLEELARKADAEVPGSPAYFEAWAELDSARHEVYAGQPDIPVDPFMGDEG